MKTTCKTIGDTTSFIIADLDAAYHDAARGLYYTQIEGGFAKSFPSHTPHLQRIYRNFERCAEEMILQAAGVRAVPWEQALLAFLERIECDNIDWYLVGSAALAARGLDIAPHDVDIIVDDAGAQRLSELLLDVLVEPFLPSERWIGNSFGRSFLHARFEWVGGVHADVDAHGATDFGPLAASRLERIDWRGAVLRVPPLDLQLDVSRRRGLTGRAEIIARAMRL